MTEPPETLNFAEHLFAANRGRAGKVAYVDDRGALRYGELEDRARRFAAALLGLGIRREERVLLLMLDSNEWPVAFLGALYAGVVPVAVNTLLTVDDYAYMLAHSRAQAAIVSASLEPTLAQGDGRGAERGRPRDRRRRGDRAPVPTRSTSIRCVERAAAARRPGRDARRRPGVLALFVGIDRQAQGHGAHPRQRLVDGRAVRQERARR